MRFLLAATLLTLSSLVQAQPAETASDKSLDFAPPDIASPNLNPTLLDAVQGNPPSQEEKLGEQPKLLPVAPSVLLEPKAAPAQSRPPDSAPLADRINFLKNEVDRIRLEVREATGENKEIAEEQLEEIHDELFELIDYQINEAGSPAPPEAAAIISDVVVAESQQLYHEIHHLERDLTKLFAIRGRLIGSELLKAEGDIADESNGLDVALQALLKNVGRKFKLGLAVDKDFKRVDSELKSRGERLAGTIRSTSESIEKFERQKAASDAGRQMIQDELHSLRGRLESILESLRHSIDLMNERGIEVHEYKQLIIEASGDLSTDILDWDVAAGLTHKLTGKAKRWLMDRGPVHLFKFILAVIIFFIFKFLARIVRMLMRALIRRSKASDLLRNLAVSIAGNAVVFVGIFIALWQMGLSPAPILAGLGIAGLVIGLALQDTISSVASGAMIILYRPFDVGDLLETDQTIGVVQSMSLMTTTLLTLQNERVTVPNSKIWGNTIKNITGEPHRRIDMKFGISYADDIDRAKEILEDVVANTAHVLEKPAPRVRVLELGDSSVNFAVRPYVEPPHYWDVYFDITEQVKRRLDSEGISIPFPQRDVHLIPQNRS